MEAFAVKDVLKKIAVEEMRHAKATAERLSYLGDLPTAKPTPIFVGGPFKEMLEQDKKNEEGAIELYKNIVKTASEENDIVTLNLLKKILAG